MFLAIVLFVLSLMASDTPLIASTFSLLRNQPRKQGGLRCQKGSGLFMYVDVYFSYNFDECFPYIIVFLMLFLFFFFS
jgi:hypothetical protein